MKLEIYYEPKRDAVIRVIDGVLINFEEGVSATDFLPDYGLDIRHPEEMFKLSTEQLMEHFKYQIEDFQGHSSKEDIHEYFEYGFKQPITGKLVISRDINAQWINRNPHEMKLLWLDTNEVFELTM